MSFCTECGNALIEEVPAGDDRIRGVCPACGHIHYVNPKVIVGCIPRWQDRILLCRRAIEPRMGRWTLPAGFMELEETSADGAARETWEEARAKVTMGPLFSVINVPHISQVYLLYLADMVSSAHAPGPESTDTRLVLPQDIPWPELAFPTIRRTLEFYVDDLASGAFTLHTDTIHWPPRVPDPRRAEAAGGKAL